MSNAELTRERIQQEGGAAAAFNSPLVGFSGSLGGRRTERELVAPIKCSQNKSRRSFTNDEGNKTVCRLRGQYERPTRIARSAPR